ncbi:MAG: DUF3617 family protein [Sulfuricellaceae bacterium]
MHLKKTMSFYPAVKASLKIAILISLGCGVSASWAAEAEPGLEAGQWEVLTRPEFPNTPFPPRPKTDQFCLTASDIAAGLIPLRTAPGCKVVGGVYKGRQLEFNITCSELPQGTGKLQPAGKTFTGRAELVVVPGQDGVGRVVFYYNYSGNRLSDCPQQDNGATEKHNGV